MQSASSPLFRQAFNELLICCETKGCLNTFEMTLLEPAKDPVEGWAIHMASLASDEGWGADGNGNVRCPSCIAASPD
jgi:hypothetical protein